MNATAQTLQENPHGKGIPPRVREPLAAALARDRTPGESEALNRRLIMAAEAGNAEKVKRLIDFLGADVNAYDRSGNTALMRAAFLGKKEVVQVLVSRGADIALSSRVSGITSLDYALYGGHYGLAELLWNLQAARCSETCQRQAA